MKGPEIGMLILVALVCLSCLFMVWKMLSIIQGLTGKVAREEGQRRRDLDDQLFRFMEKIQLLPKDSATMHAKERYNRMGWDGALEKKVIEEEGAAKARNPEPAQYAEADVNE